MKKIENIFQSAKKSPNLKKEKNSSNDNIKIIIDTREKNSLVPTFLISKGASILFQKLEVGDYKIGDIIIERKTINDLISSLKSNRLKNQLKNLKECTNPVIILEKTKEVHSSIHPNSINGIIISISLNYKVPIIYTQSEDHTAQILIQIANQKENSSSPANPNKIPKTLEEQKRFILEAFPGIGPVASKKLLQNYPNLKEIFNSSEEDLNKILNTKQLNSFLDILNSS